MSFLISDAMAAAPAGGQAPGIMGWIFPLGLVVVLYFFMIRPQIKRQKDHRKMVEALQKGDEVVTMGGIAGVLRELDDDFCQVEIAENVVIKVRRASVETVMPKGTL